MNDLIYKQEAIDAVNKCTDIYVGNLPTMVDKKEVYSVLQGLPSAQPERKRGKWKPISDGYVDIYECDQCGETEDYERNYCPNCGSFNGDADVDE